MVSHVICLDRCPSTRGRNAGWFAMTWRLDGMILTVTALPRTRRACSENAACRKLAFKRRKRSRLLLSNTFRRSRLLDPAPGSRGFM